MKYQHTPIGMTKIRKKKKGTASNDDKDGEELNHSYIAAETAE